MFVRKVAGHLNANVVQNLRDAVHEWRVQKLGKSLEVLLLQHPAGLLREVEHMLRTVVNHEADV
jgi:hypothetical protein